MKTTTSIPRDVGDAVLALCEDLATPRSLTVSLLVRSGEWDQLASLRVDPNMYLDPDSYWRDAVATSVLRKTQDLPTTFDRKAKALENFWASERSCFSTNQRLRPFLYGESYLPGEEGIYEFLLLVRKNVKAILGPCPDLGDGRFGPGATFGDRGKFSTVPDKMSSRPTLTPSAVYHLFPWSATAWAQACQSGGRDPLFIRGNRFTTVPKDCEKDRGIAVEPSINSFFQLAYGRVMKKRLKRAGIDLQNGQDIHRRVAREASLQGHLATLDLSNASDTVSRDLVKFLLPSKWFDVLNDLRSSHTFIEGKWVLLEKFSSMGNGFTFELETVIFLSIALSVLQQTGHKPQAGSDVFAFGDDIIVPTESAENVKAALRYLGFTLNEEKSFTSGSFRESCGGDFFDGVDVRPYFLKEFPYEPQHYIAMANGLRRLADSDGLYSHRPHTIRRSWFRVLDALPSHLHRLRGPKDLGDIVIHDEEGRWETRWRSSIRYIRCYRPARFRRIGWEYFRDDVVLAAALYGVGSGLHGVTPRDAVLGHKVGWVPRS